MRVLYFGTYERDYPRNAQVISSLRAAGVDVDERHVGVWEGTRHKWSLGAAAAVLAVAVGGAALVRDGATGRRPESPALPAGGRSGACSGGGWGESAKKHAARWPDSYSTNGGFSVRHRSVAR